MKLAEKILLLLSKNPEICNDEALHGEFDINKSLLLLKKNFLGFMTCIVNKKILDFGCDCGYQSLALAKAGANYVLGLDINTKALSKARNMLRVLGLDGKVEFKSSISDALKGKFDIVISQNSMEHFQNPIEVLEQMKYVLGSNGKIFLTFGPPWYAPYGSHMHFFTKTPWVNIIFSEKTVMKVRACYRNDGALRYEEVAGGLNKMTVSKFEQIISDCGMDIEYKKYDCVKGLNFFGKIPLFREFFINNVCCILVNKPK